MTNREKQLRERARKLGITMRHVQDQWPTPDHYEMKREDTGQSVTGNTYAVTLDDVEYVLDYIEKD